MGWLLTMSKKDAKVSCVALTTQVASLGIIPKSVDIDGTAEKMAAVLNVSRNCARQNTRRRT